MRTSTDCASRAEECRRLAKLAVKPADCQHFLEMAATWDMLANQRPSDKLAETCALAEAIANGRNLGLQKRASVNQMIVPAMSASGAEQCRTSPPASGVYRTEDGTVHSAIFRRLTHYRAKRSV
jgi:hypothetical protein